MLSTLDALLNALILFALFLKVEGWRYNERENICHGEKNIYNTDVNKFETECKLLEAEISLLLFYADNKFMNKPELISKYLKEVNFHEIVDSWEKLCK